MEQLTQNSLKRDVLEAQEKLEVDLEKIKDLVQKMKDPVRGVEIKNRRYYFSLHKKCFVGSEAVTWIITNGYAKNPQEAVEMGNLAMSQGHFVHVARDQPFRNGNFWYSFAHNEQSQVSKEVKEKLTMIRVVIIGGGFAGCELAKRLHDFFDVILIDSKNYFECTPAMPRALVDVGFIGNIHVPHEKHLKNVKFKHHYVAEVSPNRVLLETGEEVSFDYLIICSGSSYTPPVKMSVADQVKVSAQKNLTFKDLFSKSDTQLMKKDPGATITIIKQESFSPGQTLMSTGGSLMSKGDNPLKYLLNFVEDRRKVMTEIAKEIASARAIIIVGGGPVAVELAAEIAHKYPKVSITMITEGPSLLLRMPPSARKTAEEYLKKKNVNIVFGERVDLEKIRSLNKYTTSSGKTYEADLVLNMVGIQPNTKFMKRNFPTILDEWGFIKVNQFLQLEGYSNIFAVGDCNNRKEEKLAYHAVVQAKKCVGNIIKLASGLPMKPYTPPTAVMLVSLGPNNGISTFNSKQVPSPGLVLGKMKETINKSSVHEVSGCFADPSSNKKCFTCQMSAKFLGGGGATKGVKIERKLKASTQRTMRTSIIRNEDQLDTLTENVPKHRIFPILDTEKPHVSFVGPAENNEEQIGLPYACGQSISTYPMLPKGRMGEPVCDAYAVSVFPSYSAITIADGCNWGKAPRDAAQCAVKTMDEYIKSNASSMKNTTQIPTMLLEGFMKAHNSIVDVSKLNPDATPGTTTLLSGIVVRLEEHEEDQPFLFVCASVGDCKAFHLIARTAEIVEITEGNRDNLADVTNCGGRIGPYLENDEPDLANLGVFFEYVEPGDMIFCVSDGVADNFDPYFFGKKPAQVGVEVSPDKNSWAEIDKEKGSILFQSATTHKAEFIRNLMLQTCGVVNKKPLDSEWDPKLDTAKFLNLSLSMTNLQASLTTKLTPVKVVRSLIDHCKKVTNAGRTYMETNSGKQPDDYVNYPGKMDHTTCVCIQIQAPPTMLPVEISVINTAPTTKIL